MVLQFCGSPKLNATQLPVQSAAQAGASAAYMLTEPGAWKPMHMLYLYNLLLMVNAVGVGLGQALVPYGLRVTDGDVLALDEVDAGLVEDETEMVVEMTVTEIVLRVEAALAVGLAALTGVTPTREYAFQP
jgi:hypothetical protein